MTSAFHLEVDGEGLATLTFDQADRSVNVFDRATMAELESRIDEVGGRRDIRCLVLLSGKLRTFIAGADIEEIAGVTDAQVAEAGARLGQRLFSAWSGLPFPTVAAVRGTCVGGGTELALASTHILVSDREDVRIGLPEIRLGILPAWGGCSRLPRRVGIAAALDIILAGKTVRPRKALKIGLADALIPDASFPRHVREFALRVAAGPISPRRAKGGVRRALLEGNPLGRGVVFDQARKQVMARTGGHYPAPLRAIEVVRTGVSKGLQAGMDAEARAIGELAVSPTCKSLVHVFRLMEGAKRGRAGSAPRPVRQTAVLGAGVMGGGIAQLIADKADIPVRLKDIAEEPLARGMAHAAKLFRKQVERRWIRRPVADRKMSLLRPSLDYSGFGAADLVIEAVVEKLEIKQKVFADVAAETPPDAVLASNTSSLSIDRIGEETPHPERVIGMHFFNPVDKMPLVEVVVGERTSEEAIATVIDFSRRLGKTPVVVKSGPGFLVNRLLTFSLAEALWLLDEGCPIETLDRVMKEWGMPMGPITLTDEVGIDVATKVAHILAEAYGERLTLPSWLDKMAENGRLGAKAGAGFYRYDGGKRLGPDSRVYALIGLSPVEGKVAPEEIADRIALPMINEAARCLDEGIVASPEELDLAMIMGTGFPPFRGGLCRWADTQGLDQLEEAMRRLAGQVGPRFTPSAAFTARVAAGGFYVAA